MNRVLLAMVAIITGVCAVTWIVWRRDAVSLSSIASPTQTEWRAAVTIEPAVTLPSSIVFNAEPLPFRYERGDSGSAWPVEPIGGGVGIADFDGDGLQDLFFAQGVPLPVRNDPAAPADMLLRNRGGREFEDVSSSASIQSRGYGMGVAQADIDADGFPDVYVTRYGANTLWQNQGDGGFRDVTEQAEVGCPLWSLGAAFADLDGDGDLDLFVANYFWFDPALAPFARDPATGAADYGAPSIFEGEPDFLYSNDGDGHFTEMHTEAGIDDRDRGMGVLAADFDKDGRMDIFVANDAQQNTLWHNRGDGAFENVALSWGAAVNARGQTEANMGIAYGDTDSDGNSDLFVTHLVNEHDTLWRAHWAQQTVVFSDETYDAGLGHDSRKFTGWGTAFADFDLDGHLDIVVANGHIRREGNQPFVYENLPLLWHNRGARFANVSDSAGPYFQSLAIARGLAAADLDLDGDMDLVVVHHYERSVVLWNESPRRGASLTVRLRGTGFNRQAIGAQLVARIGERSIVRSIDGGGSYNSANDLQVHFGLGPVTLVDFLQVRWPSGLTTTLERVQVNQHLETAENVSDRDNR